MPGTREFETTVAAIRSEHVRTAAIVIDAVEIVRQLTEEIDAEIVQVLVVLRSAQRAQSFSEQSKDFVVSRGEKLSCLFMAALLRSRNVDATCVDLSNLLPSFLQDGTSSILLGRPLYEAITRELTICIERDCKHGIPIITGFFGGMPGGLLRTVGRGYSDLCAALVAVALGAQELQIWKEVDGVFNADPRKVPTASLLESITPSEAAELSFYGAEVIHPSAMEHVIRANIPIRVKNVMSPGNPGTRIDPVKAVHARRASGSNQTFQVRAKDHEAVAAKRSQIKPVAISVKQNMLVVNIQTRDRSCSSSNYFAKIFSIVEQYSLQIDLISSSEMNVSLALLLSEQISGSVREKDINDDENLIIEDHNLRSALYAFNRLGVVDVLPNMAIISLIGDGLKQMVGISAEFFGILAENHINIEMISQGKMLAHSLTCRKVES